ncbi:MAG TPA: TonB-dependent receptor [Caulobacteraceae bacterium]
MRATGSRQRKSSVYWLSSSLLASTILATGSVACAATASASAAADTGGSTAVGELIVTAQKREENIQNVAASVQALGTAKLEQLHIVNFNDYIKYLPSVSYQSLGPGYSNVYMRGVAADNQSNHSGSLPSVGTYLDEQPITTIGGALDIHVYDIARVESLSGPQGTLYGASSEAGTIRIITNKPELGVFKGAADVEVNGVDHGGTGYSGEGFVNIPVSEHAAVRLVAWGEHDAGYIDNVPGTRTFTSGKTINNSAFVKNDYNTADIYGGRAELKVDLNENWTLLPTLIAQDEKSNGVFGYDPTLGDLKVQHFHPETNHDRWYQASLTVQGKIANLDLTYSGSHMDRRIDSRSDYTDYTYFYDQLYASSAQYVNNNGDIIADPAQQIIGYDHFTKDSHELRIASPASDRFRFLGGLFYQRQTHHIIQDYVISDLSTGQSVGGWPGTWWLTNQQRVDRDYAVFGEASYDITPQLTVTGGVRVYKYDNSLVGFYGFGAGSGHHTGELLCAGRPAIVPDTPCTDLNTDVTGTGETHKVNLTYHLQEGKLVYFTYSTGFRPGGVNRNGGFPPYKPDSLDNFELGWKTSWLGNSLVWNGAVFYDKWRNFQFAYLGPNSLTIVNNAGDANIYGVESNVIWRPTHALTISAAAAYTDAKLAQDFCNGDCVNNPVSAPKGEQLPVTPKFKTNATVRYEFDMMGLESHLQGSLVYQSSSWSDLLTADRTTLGQQPAYTTVDFSGGIVKDKWSLEVTLLNAFDTRAQLYRYTECTISVCGAGATYIAPNKPRTISVRVGAKF